MTRRILITGGNSGIGKVTATQLSKDGFEVVIAGRPGKKTEEALREINVEAQIPVVSLDVDLASFESVRELAATFKANYDGLDVLLNNAGAFTGELGLTQEGFEIQFGVNHLAHFLLTDLLLDELEKATAARVVTVTSMLHKKGVIDYDNLRGEKKYNSQAAYNRSKLANVMFGIELAERVKDRGITSNVLHPGAVKTDIARDMPWIVRKVLDLIFISPRKGALTNIMLASDPTVEGITGKYYNQCKLEEYANEANDPAARKRLWEMSEEVTKAP